MKFLEMVMRFSPPAIAMALALLTVSSMSYAKRADNDILPGSILMTNSGKAALSGGKFDDANDALEAALAIDPRNREAFITLARVAQKQGLPGKAIRFYREALLIEPNDVIALSGQGEAMVARGALAKARENLTRITQLCPTACQEQSALSAAIEKGAATPSVSAQAIQPKPVVTEAPKPPAK
jgi:Tfp pilus assembly protein PilF